MTQAFTDLANYPLRVKSAAERRALAVGAALTIIYAKAANTPDNCGIISDEMEQLGKYADQIEEALKAK